ncbi:SLC13 family permease [Thiomonas sp.]|uniref:SLC13 family permease n=1 Tax=Thiomonas sp. TaxID=2047785 RepID=UPI0026205DD4|nr:SLC13 family permease [Thiomonas sp.]
MGRSAWARACWSRLRRERLLLVFGGLALALQLVDPQPWPRWRAWLALPTLLGLFALLLSIEGIRASGAVQRAAQALARRVHDQRTLALALVAGSALLSMVLTNDVSLFLLVPLTLALGRGSALPVRRVVILEALGVNAGSALSPVGNPQNLLLWQHSGLSMAQFVWRMLPAAGTMLVLLACAVWLLVPARALAAGGAPAASAAPLRPALGWVSVLLLLGVLALLQEHRATLAAALALLVFVVGWREVPRRVDWGLLGTLAAMFVGLGHLAQWGPLQAWLLRPDWHAPLVLYAGGVLLSQVLSNVPATVLLWPHVGHPLALAVAVNVGGFGLALGSLANLIALRLEGGRGNLGEFHRISLPFLLVCAPLVWLVTRVLG